MRGCSLLHLAGCAGGVAAGTPKQMSYGVAVGTSGNVRLSGFVAVGKSVGVAALSGGPGGAGAIVDVMADVGLIGAVGRTVSGGAVGAGVGWAGGSLTQRSTVSSSVSLTR